jgi:threonine dehydrogenase-like Zn-dependent dehydrogenase
LVLKTTIVGEYKVSFAPLVINEITVVGSRCGPFAPALDALEERSVLVTPLIDKVYPLSDGVEAVAHAGRPGTHKILLRP